MGMEMEDVHMKDWKWKKGRMEEWNEVISWNERWNERYIRKS